MKLGGNSKGKLGSGKLARVSTCKRAGIRIKVLEADKDTQFEKKVIACEIVM